MKTLFQVSRVSASGQHKIVFNTYEHDQAVARFTKESAKRGKTALLKNGAIIRLAE